MQKTKKQLTQLLDTKIGEQELIILMLAGVHRLESAGSALNNIEQ